MYDTFSTHSFGNTILMNLILLPNDLTANLHWSMSFFIPPRAVYTELQSLCPVLLHTIEDMFAESQEILKRTHIR